MQRKYGEFITVRKQVENVSSSLTYTERNFLGGSGYIVSCTREQENQDNDETDSYESMGSKWIKLSIENHKMSKAEIHTMVDKLYCTYTCETMSIVNNVMCDDTRGKDKLTSTKSSTDLQMQTETGHGLIKNKQTDTLAVGKIMLWNDLLCHMLLNDQLDFTNILF